MVFVDGDAQLCGEYFRLFPGRHLHFNKFKVSPIALMIQNGVGRLM
jgi:hypothetical protein